MFNGLDRLREEHEGDLQGEEPVSRADRCLMYKNSNRNGDRHRDIWRTMLDHQNGHHCWLVPSIMVYWAITDQSQSLSPHHAAI